jgi:hypothetical protein
LLSNCQADAAARSGYQGRLPRETQASSPGIKLRLLGDAESIPKLESMVIMRYSGSNPLPEAVFRIPRS